MQQAEAEKIAEEITTTLFNSGASITRLIEREQCRKLIANRLRGVVLNGREDQLTVPIERLSPRETQVFEMVGLGMRTSQIANRMHLSPKTIETYHSTIMEKLRIDGCRALVRIAAVWCWENGITETGATA